MNDAAAERGAGLSDAEILARFQNSRRIAPASQTLGSRIIAIDQAARRVDVEFDARADVLTNPMGQIQGGIVCALLDEAMSVSVVVASGLTCFAPTLEMKTSFLRPALPGRLLAIGSVVKWGRTIAFTEGALYDPQGELLARASGTVMPTPMTRFGRGPKET
jgi:uncharacterized protein (TIGR00369 family)